jgi:hypothetical protein
VRNRNATDTRRRYVSSPLLAAVIGLPLVTDPGAAQGRILDRAVFVITRGSEVVGREEFVIRQGRAAGQGDGYTISAQAFYPDDRTTPTMVSTIQCGPDSQPTAARLDADTDDRPSVFVSINSRRITVRKVTPSGESARQFPAVDRTLLLDDLLISPYALLPSSREGSLTTIDPRSGDREVVALVDLGLEVTTVHGASVSLRHFTLGNGSSAKHLWFDELGRLIKVTIGSLQLTATRAYNP